MDFDQSHIKGGRKKIIYGARNKGGHAKRPTVGSDDRYKPKPTDITANRFLVPFLVFIIIVLGIFSAVLIFSPGNIVQLNPTVCQWVCQILYVNATQYSVVYLCPEEYETCSSDTLLNASEMVGFATNFHQSSLVKSPVVFVGKENSSRFFDVLSKNDVLYRFCDYLNDSKPCYMLGLELNNSWDCLAGLNVTVPDLVCFDPLNLSLCDLHEELVETNASLLVLSESPHDKNGTFSNCLAGFFIENSTTPLISCMNSGIAMDMSKAADDSIIPFAVRCTPPRIESTDILNVSS